MTEKTEIVTNRYNKLSPKKPLLWDPLAASTPLESEFEQIERNFREKATCKDPLKANVKLDYMHPLYSDIQVKEIFSEKTPEQLFSNPNIRKLLRPVQLHKLLNSLMEKIEIEKKNNTRMTSFLRNFESNEQNSELLEQIYQSIFLSEEYLDKLAKIREKIVDVLISSNYVFRKLKKLYRIKFFQQRNEF